MNDSRSRSCRISTAIATANSGCNFCSTSGVMKSWVCAATLKASVNSTVATADEPTPMIATATRSRGGSAGRYAPPARTNGANTSERDQVLPEHDGRGR